MNNGLSSTESGEAELKESYDDLDISNIDEEETADFHLTFDLDEENSKEKISKEVREKYDKWQEQPSKKKTLLYTSRARVRWLQPRAYPEKG